MRNSAAMLNRLLERKNGSAEDPAALSAVLEELERDLEGAKAEVADLRSRRHDLLLSDASDHALDALERKIERAEVRIEKMELALPRVREQLSVAQAAARRSAEGPLVREFVAVAERYAAALRACAAADRELAEIRSEAREEIDPARVPILMPLVNYAGVLEEEHVNLWWDRVAPVLAVSRAMSSPDAHPASLRVQPPPATARGPATRPASLQHAVSLGQDAPIPKAPRAADDTAPLESGEVRVKVLRAGFSPAEDRPQAAYAQLLRMNAAAALLAADRGAVQIVETRPSEARGAAPVEAGAP